MANSMTGYGRHQGLYHGRDITVEIKAVNHRYFDFSCRAPRAYGFLEERLKKLVQSCVSRGKVDVYVAIAQVEGPDVSVSLNDAMLRSYLQALHRMRPCGPTWSLPPGVRWTPFWPCALPKGSA